MTAPNFIEGLTDAYELEIRLLGIDVLVDFYFDGTLYFIRVDQSESLFGVIPKFNGELYKPVFLYNGFVIVSVFGCGSFNFNVSIEDLKAGKYVIHLKYDAAGNIEVELIEDVS